MKNLPLAALALGGLVSVSSAAFAADLPLKAPPLVAPYDWTGFYGGANIGGMFGRAYDVVNAPPGTPFSAQNVTVNGGEAGLQGGYNWQTGWWVVGVEADIQWASPTGNYTSTNAAATATLNDMETLNWFGTGRGRFGVTPAPGWLVYGTGGVAVGQIRSDEVFVGTLFTSALTTTRIGWTAGGGVEAAITTLPTGTWTARIEALYIDFGTWNNTFPGPIGATSLSVHATELLARIGLEYRWAPAPLVANY